MALIIFVTVGRNQADFTKTGSEILKIYFFSFLDKTNGYWPTWFVDRANYPFQSRKMEWDG